MKADQPLHCLEICPEEYNKSKTREAGNNKKGNFAGYIHTRLAAAMPCQISIFVACILMHGLRRLRHICLC